MVAHDRTLGITSFTSAHDADAVPGRGERCPARSVVRAWPCIVPKMASSWWRRKMEKGKSKIQSDGNAIKA